MSRGRGFQRGWWLVLITLGVMYTAAVPFMFINAAADSFLYMLCGEGVLIIPLIVGVFMLFWENTDKPVSEQMGLCGFPLRLVPYILLMVLCAKGFSVFFMAPAQAILSALLGLPDYSDIEVGVFWQNFMILCVLAPILEEAICRGVIMQLFKRYGTAASLIFSSLAFAMMHQSAQTFFAIFFLGMLLGLIRLTTGSLLASILAHAASNFYSLCVLSGSAVSETIIEVIGIAAATAFPFVLIKYMGTVSGCVRQPKVEKNVPVGFSVALLIVILIFAAVNIRLFAMNVIDAGMDAYDIFSGEMVY